MDALEREGGRSEENIFFFVPHNIALTRYSSPVACPQSCLITKQWKWLWPIKRLLCWCVTIDFCLQETDSFCHVSMPVSTIKEKMCSSVVLQRSWKSTSCRLPFAIFAISRWVQHHHWMFRRLLICLWLYMSFWVQESDKKMCLEYFVVLRPADFWL